MDTLKTRITVNRLHPLFVAEVTGIDLTVTISREDFRAIWDLMTFGLKVLARIAGAPAVVTACRTRAAQLAPLNGLVTRAVAGNYPAHDPGVLLYRTKTAPDQNHAWFIAGQDVLLIAELLQTGRYPTERIVSLGGPAAKTGGHLRTRIGAPLAVLTKGRTAGGEVRQVVGGILTGASASPESFLGLFDKSLVVLQEGRQPGAFLAWTLPGGDRPSYSRTFLSAWMTLGVPVS